MVSEVCVSGTKSLHNLQQSMDIFSGRCLTKTGEIYNLDREKGWRNFDPYIPKTAVRSFLALFFCSLKQTKFEEKLFFVAICHYEARFPESA